MIAKTDSRKIWNEEGFQINLLKGLNILVTLIKQTYGTNGKNIIFDSKKLPAPELSKDGNYIIKNLLLRDKLKSLVILLVEEAFRPLKSDGLNTFFLISSSMITKGIRYLRLTPENLTWCEGMQKTIYYIFSRIETNSQPITNDQRLHQVIDRFLPGEKDIAEILGKTFTKQNINASLEIETNVGGETIIEKENGMKLNYGYSSPYFLTDSNKKLIDFSNPCILIANYCLRLDNDEFAEWLEPIIYQKRPLIIISPEIEEELLNTLILNKLNGIIEVAYIKINTNSILDNSNLEDIANYTNSEIVKEDKGWKRIKRQQLGEAKQVIISSTKTLIICDEQKLSSRINDHYNALQSQLLLSNSEYEAEKLTERQKNFLGIRSKLRLGGATLVEAQELRKRVETALLAIQNCVDEGISIGGVTSFLHIGEEVENWSRSNLTSIELVGARIVNTSVQEPIRILLSNQSSLQTNLKNPSIIIEKIKSSKDEHIGYDLKTETLLNMNKNGIIDSVSTLRKGLSTALSLSLMMLSITYIIY